MNSELERLRVAVNDAVAALGFNGWQSQIAELNTAFLVLSDILSGNDKAPVAWCSLKNGEIFRVGLTKGALGIDTPLYLHQQSALESTPAQGVPEGYALVPIKPTEEMFEALGNTPWVIDGHMEGNTFIQKEFRDQRYITDGWEAMLKAAPSARTAPADVVGLNFRERGWKFETFQQTGTMVATYPDGTERSLDLSELGSASCRRLLDDLIRAVTAATTAPVVGDDRDAERYRWLKAGGYEHADDGQPYIVVHRQDSYGNWHDAIIEDGEVDAAIDSAMGIDTARTAKADGDGWSGWATQYPGKMPKLYGAREIAELNWHPGEGAALIRLVEVERLATDRHTARTVSRGDA